MHSETFLEPKLTGKRFDGGMIPLVVLADFAVLEEMIVEVAKWRYREANPHRKRVPRGFTNGIQLKLTGIKDGSAIPIITLFVAASSLVPPSSQPFFDEARSAFIGAIGAAQHGKVITQFLPKELLGYFDHFGRNLIDGEAIEFTEGPNSQPVRLTKETRRTLVLASSADEVTEETVLHGVIPEMDQQAESFHIRLMDGTKVKAPLTRQHCKTVLEAFIGYQQGLRARMSAIGRFSRSNRLESIASVEHISVLDPLDMGVRIDELKLLRPGWLDGKGLPPDRDALDWLAGELDRRYPDDIILPYLYPTIEGGVRAEWPIKPYELSLQIDLANRVGSWHSLNLDSDDEQSRKLDLNAETDWDWIFRELRGHGGVNA
jgi:hypothetical protein